MLKKGDVVKIIDAAEDVTVELIEPAKTFKNGTLKWKVLNEKTRLMEYYYEWPFDPSNKDDSSNDWFLLTLTIPQVKTGPLKDDGEQQRRGLPVQKRYRVELTEQSMEEEWNKYFRD